MLHTDIQTDRHTDSPTKRVLEEHSLLKKFIFTWSFSVQLLMKYDVCTTLISSLRERKYLKLKSLKPQNVIFKGDLSIRSAKGGR